MDGMGSMVGRISGKVQFEFRVEKSRTVTVVMIGEIG